MSDPQTPAADDLNLRSEQLLKTLIREFVRTGKPVGSRRLSKLNREGLSAATIRNAVADLEEMGYVEQPYTSAGRIPTAKGYRFYVSSLSPGHRLSDRSVDRIRDALSKETDPDALLTKTSRLLSSLSNNVGFVLTPPISMAVMKHLEFVKIAPRRILVILVSQTGLVQHRLIRVEEEFSQTDLDQAGSYLVRNYAGRTLAQVRDELIRLMSEEKALYDKLLKRVLLLGSASLMGADEGKPEDSDVYLGGTAKMMEKSELGDVKRMVALFQTFERKSQLVKLLSECVRLEDAGPTVTIGLEDHIPGMRDMALISSPYATEHGVGTLGILGPSRMEYQKIISLVDYVAKLCGELLARNSHPVE